MDNCSWHSPEEWAQLTEEHASRADRIRSLLAEVNKRDAEIARLTAEVADLRCELAGRPRRALEFWEYPK